MDLQNKLVYQYVFLWKILNKKEIDRNIEIAGRAREEYAKNVRARQEELKATSHENREQLEPVQEVIVDRPRGFWGWLKSLFT